MWKRLSLGFALVALLLALPAVAFADSQVRFTATTPLAIVGFEGTEAEFKLDRTGDIRLVKVETEGEQVLGAPITVTDCQPPGDPFCDNLAGSSFQSVHDSRVVLTQLRVVDGDSVGFPGFPEVLVVGNITGKLKGEVLILKDGSTMEGEMELRIGANPDSPPSLPAAIYVCLDPGPAPLDPCIEGEGQLVPGFLNIRDLGKLKVTEGTGVFEEVKEVKARVEVVVVGVVGSPDPIGQAVIRGEVKKEEHGEEHD